MPSKSPQNALLPTTTQPETIIKNDPLEMGKKKAQQIVQQIAARRHHIKEPDRKGSTTDISDLKTSEIVVNDFAQKVRWRLTNKENVTKFTEESGAAITTRGVYVLPGKEPQPNERKLYLFIEGSEKAVQLARTLIKREMQSAIEAELLNSTPTLGTGRYKVN